MSALALAVTGEALACVCVDAPLRERLDDSDAAVVGRVVGERELDVNGVPQRLLTIEVDQRVKGGVDGTIAVRSPSGSDCDVAVPRERPVGLLLRKAPDGALLASACSVVPVAALVVEGGEPRGGVVKVGVGLAILALVLLWSIRRLRRGARPQLPGAPGS